VSPLMRWLLWVAAVVIVPVPFFLAQTGTVPAARILMLGISTLLLIVVEGAQGKAGVAAGLLLAQAGLYCAVLWLATRILVRLLGRLPRPAAVSMAALLLAVGIAVACGFDVYRDPFRHRALHTNLLHVYE